MTALSASRECAVFGCHPHGRPAVLEGRSGPLGPAGSGRSRSRGQIAKSRTWTCSRALRWNTSGRNAGLTVRRSGSAPPSQPRQLADRVAPRLHGSSVRRIRPAQRPVGAGCSSGPGARHRRLAARGHRSQGALATEKRGSRGLVRRTSPAGPASAAVRNARAERWTANLLHWWLDLRLSDGVSRPAGSRVEVPPAKGLQLSTCPQLARHRRYGRKTLLVPGRIEVVNWICRDQIWQVGADWRVPCQGGRGVPTPPKVSVERLGGISV